MAFDSTLQRTPGQIMIDQIYTRAINGLRLNIDETCANTKHYSGADISANGLKSNIAKQCVSTYANTDVKSIHDLDPKIFEDLQTVVGTLSVEEKKKIIDDLEYIINSQTAAVKYAKEEVDQWTSITRDYNVNMLDLSVIYYKNTRSKLELTVKMLGVVKKDI